VAADDNKVRRREEQVAALAADARELDADRTRLLALVASGDRLPRGVAEGGGYMV
jgi:hypothetical protein